MLKSKYRYMFCRNQLGIFLTIYFTQKFRSDKTYFSTQLLNNRFSTWCSLLFRIFYFSLNTRENSESYHENSFLKTFLVYVFFKVKTHLICGCNGCALVTSQMSPNNAWFCTVVPNIVYFHPYSGFLWEFFFVKFNYSKNYTFYPQTL